MEEFSNLNFNHYVNLFTSSNDIVSLQELYLLKERCPEFNFCKYKVGIFTLPNIEKFGQDFLLANYEWLTQSILELSIEKVLYLLKKRKLTSFDCDALEKLSIDALDKICEIDDLDEVNLFSELSKCDKFVDNLNLLLKNRKATSFIAKNFEDVYSHYLRETVENFILDEDSERCVSFIDLNYITTSSNLQNFLKSYFLCKDALMFTDDDNKHIYNDLLFNNHILKLKVDDIEKYNNYFDIKYEKVINLLNNNLDDAKSLISKLYFNIDIEILEKALNTAKKCKLFEKYTRFLEIETFDEIVEFIQTIKYETNIYYDIEEKLSRITKKSICDSMQPKYKLNNGIVHLDGCNFSFLVHSIKGYANMEKAELLAENPSYWYSNPKEDSYISTSFISNDFMGINNSISYILGFNSIVEDDILYSGLGDLYSSTKQVRNNLRNAKSSCVLAEDLRLDNKMIYNEVTLKRVRNGSILKPDFILSLDQIKSVDEQASKYFNVPIYLLERIKYAARMAEKLEEDLYANDLDAYISDLRRMFLSFYNCDNIFFMYFNPDKLESNTLKIVRKYINSAKSEVLQKVVEIIELYDQLITLYNFYKEDAIEYEKERYVNMLKKS